jgi:hypothetical protein
MFSTKENDNYETPNEIIDTILTYIGKDKIIYEPFYCNGRSGKYITSKGYECIHKMEDFFEQNVKKNEYDCIVSNPPFSDLSFIYRKLQTIDKPFALLVPLETLARKYLMFKDVQIIILKKSIHFIKNGVRTNRPMPKPLCWVCYKMELPRDIIFID